LRPEDVFRGCIEINIPLLALLPAPEEKTNMSDQITRVDYYIGTIPNKTGEGARVLKAFRDAGFNLAGALGYKKSARLSEVVFVVDEKTKPAPVARKLGLSLEKGKGFLIQGEDRPGAMAEYAEKLANASININSLHGLCAGGGRFGALLTVDAADMRKAARVLGV
jgi:hypothetical protein